MNDHKPQLDRYLNVRKDLVVNPPEFKDVEEIRINEQDLKELNKLYHNNRNQEQFYVDSKNQSFKRKNNEIFSKLDQLAQPQQNSDQKHRHYDNRHYDNRSPQTFFKKYEYYDLNNVNYDEKETISDAFAFLRSLEKNKQAINQKQVIEKPQFNPKKTKMTIENEKINVKNLKQQVKLLSFQEEIDQ